MEKPGIKTREKMKSFFLTKLVQILVDCGIQRLKKKLDKDRFRRDLGNIIEGYQEVARRLGIMPEIGNIKEVNFNKPSSIKFKKK